MGRLDKPSEGLIFLTSDGDIVNKVLRARNHHEKEYHVTVDKPIRGSFINDMAGGVPILGTVTRRCEVEQTGPKQFRIVLTQGLNRQIRRMCEHLGYNVVRLKRVRIMHMHLDLPRGEWRDFTAGELRELQRLVNESSKTHDGQVDRPVVIGGGAAGIAACLTLEAAGKTPILIEGGDRLGGRLRTERMSDGTPVDVGFQVLLTAYPELQRWTDMAALEPVRFVPGARIHRAGQWCTLADPRRRPTLIPATLFSGIGTWSDRLRILRMVARVRRGPAEAVRPKWAGTTLEGLRDAGFFEVYRGFPAPLLLGNFLSRDLAPPMAQFQHLAHVRLGRRGEATRWCRGIGAPLGRTNGAHRGCSASALAVQDRAGTRGVHRGRPGHLHGARVVVVTARVLERGIECRLRGRGRALWLAHHRQLPEAHTVTNFHYMADVQGQGEREN